MLKCLLICNIGLFIDWCDSRRTQKTDTVDMFSHIFDYETIFQQNMIYFGEFLVQLSQDRRHSQQLNSFQHMKIDLGDSLRMSLWSVG